MGCTAILGAGGAGKSSLITAFVKHCLRTEGQTRLRKCNAMIDKFNEGRKTPLSKPDRVPIFTNFDMTFKVGYQETYKPYFIDEEYFGLPGLDKLVAPVAPWSVIGLQEMDDAYNSRGRNIARAVAGLYNKRRHFGLEIFMDLHRFMILDSIIREVTDVFLEIQKQEHIKNFAGRIVQTKWYCRKFTDPKEIKRYVESEGEEGEYKNVVYVHDGDIFNCYDSHSCAKEFVPKDGEDFIYLPHKSEIDITTLPAEMQKFYTKGAGKKCVTKAA